MSEINGKRGVLARAFDILGCFTGGEPERSVADICAVTDLPPATVHRMLATLSEHGAIERTGRGRYRLGPRLWRLGHGVPDIRLLRDCARPALVDLHASTRLPVALVTREGDRQPGARVQVSRAGAVAQQPAAR
uniref:helix-turn-helix domain-containing protein n=1 Tax=Streptomyces hirsutus TaxID=35620 RepID=UPI000A8BA00D